MRQFITFFITICIFFVASAAQGVEDAVYVDIYIKDHKFSPSVIELPQGRKIIITVHNQDLTIEEFESIDLKREKIVLGNSETKIVLAPLKPGEYKFFGDFHQDTAQGKIIIKEIANEAEKDV
ncbi:MAG: cupredoxin domain-containing protein [Rickettsiaceae bacterium]|jgi:plastocyanin|nr:cupredoxin domain-containing protein [Rickettsiaceae bacterium]